MNLDSAARRWLPNQIPPEEQTADPTAAGPNTLLVLRDVRRQFGTDPAIHALSGVDLVLNRGDWLAITGPSGAGKSDRKSVE